MGKVRMYTSMKKSFSYINPTKKPQSSSSSGKRDDAEENSEISGGGALVPLTSSPSFNGNSSSSSCNVIAKVGCVERTCSRIEQRNQIQCVPEVDSDEDDGEVFAKNLNGIILQYLEACGLTETYTTFYDECKSSGMLIPSQFKAELESGITLQDVETLLMHFDLENGDALLELWEVLTGMVDEGQHANEVGKITFFIQVHIALIPYRQRMSESKKLEAMSKLRGYFETQSERCTMDKEMLALFALPFVPDPESHPVFGTLFKIAWVKKLRSRIKNLARALCCPDRLVTREETDLAKMFNVCANAIPHYIKSSDGKELCIFTNVQPVHFTSGAIVSPSPSDVNDDEDFIPSQLFQRMNDLILENERYKSEESKFEKRCAQLLNVSLLLAQSLEEAAQGKEVNMEKLRHEVNQCLPVPIQEESNPPPISGGSSARPMVQFSSGNTSGDECESNQDSLLDVDIVDSSSNNNNKSKNDKNIKSVIHNNAGR